MNPRKFNLQQSYDMPDQSTGKKLREFPYSRSVSIDRYSESAPDETTISMFSQSLEQHKLGEKVQGDGIECLGSGMELRRGSIVDATITRVEASTENKKMEWANKISGQEINGNKRLFTQASIPAGKERHATRQSARLRQRPFLETTSGFLFPTLQ